jgi:hypothetical protein
MHHVDAYRSGVQSHETKLTPANIGTKTFGKLFSMYADGAVYAEPLWVGDCVMNDGKAHNVLFVATQHDSVYAYDADGKGPEYGYYWHANLLGKGETSVPSADAYPGGGADILPEVGITGTPVIDRKLGVLYVVAKSKLVSGGNTTYIQRLHALSLSTGRETMNGPVVIQASVPGNGYDAANGVVTFNPLTQNQRSALAEADGSVWIAWASHGDGDPYHGWVIGYSATNITKQTGVFNDTPNGYEGGIWMSGGGPSVDAQGNLYLASGNGVFDASTGGSDYASTIFKFTPSADSTALDPVTSFTPYDQANLSGNDLDMGTGSCVLIDNPTPGAQYPHLLASAGKDGTIYLVDRDQMGGYMQNTNEDVQDFSDGGFDVHQNLAFFNNQLYIAPDGGPLSTWTFNPATGLFNTNPATAPDSSFGCDGCDGAGATPTISANGTENPIVWIVDNSNYNFNPAVLHAFNASLTTELYNSTWAAGNRDQAGIAVKFATPTVANGFVYVGGLQSVTAYGLFSEAPATAKAPVFSPPAGHETLPVTVTITDATPNAIIHYTVDGSLPNITSPTYKAPIPISSTTLLQAMAVADGYAPGFASSGEYLFGTPGDIFTFDTAFTASDIAVNGTAKAYPSRIELTDGGNGEVASAFFHTPVKITNFTVNFDMQMNNAVADGMTFVLQNQGLTALGGNGGSLGYGPNGTAPGITPSAAIKFDLYDNAGEGPDSTGLFLNGAAPTVPAIDLTPYDIDLHSGDIFSVQLRYNGAYLTETLTDTETKKTFTKTYTVALPKVLGANTAIVGFTGGTGGAGVLTEILNWSFNNPKTQPMPASSWNPTVTGPALTTYSNPTFPAGTGELFPANAVGQSLRFTVTAAADATYAVSLLADRGPNRGIVELVIDGKVFGQPVDNYTASPESLNVNYGTILLTQGAHTFEFKVTGKNAASSGYEATFGQLTLTP